MEFHSQQKKFRALLILFAIFFNLRIENSNIFMSLIMLYHLKVFIYLINSTIAQFVAITYALLQLLMMFFIKDMKLIQNTTLNDES